MTEPTDAELLAEWDRVSHIADAGQRRLACLRAVLAKRGTPAPAGVEPYCWHYWNIAGTSVLHLGRSNKLDADIAASKKHPDAHHVVPLYTAPQPTQTVPPAERVPLTDEQLYLERRFAVSSLFHLIEQWTDKKIQSHQLADEAGKIVDHVIRRTESAHGIKGGQHGAE